MKRAFMLILLATALLYYACDNFDDPAIPEINNCSLSLTNAEGIPLSNVWVKVYYSDNKPDFVVDSTFTSVLGKASLQSLEPRDYILKAFRENGEELGATEIVVTSDNASNNVEWALDVFVDNYTFTVMLVDNKDKPIVGRKVELLTMDGGDPVSLKEGLSDAEGKVAFAKTVAGTYNVYVYDDNNISVFAQAVSTVGAGESNSETFLIQKIYHNSDIVITGFVHDPRGSDSPVTGAVSGDGLVHPGQYEYVQLMALKDINFAETNYSVVFTNTTSPTEYGWAEGLYDEASKKVYQINLTTGSVSKGQYFYVGGSARAICSYYQLTVSPQLDPGIFWGVDYAAQAGGNGNGAAKSGSGLLGNGSGKSQSSVTKSAPDGIAVFKGINVDENTVPTDAIFFGTSVTYQAYQMPDNDVYSRTNSDTGEQQALFGEGTNTYLFPVGAQDVGTFIKLGGKVTSTEWLTPRSGTVFLFNMKDYPGASTADIENSADCTVFVDK
ncbi:hypothetical protein INQ51_10320 [Maribellus sp. CM-23]|uniref:hypothetical protein n=1 Tax=Maribellus sp. CM-23 TaxID=2781026 RepID=UPI001F45114B|nr:hypothetical protein [Maribellus sp. CM-23]MCE4564705.1 hypothetical protein [Maribellus sp. CM-23]